ncbi:MAG: efflux RND transporter permease subunit [Fusobacteriaceae bacterium]
MKLINYSIKNSLVIRYLTVLIIIGGIFSYFKLGKLEDPEFKIKEAIIVTIYPGASPHEVELEVTDKIEQALRQIGDLSFIESKSKAGYSEVKLSMKESLSSLEIEQYWDVLRRKVNDVQRTLPSGTLPSVVIDDYGDVYGIFLGVTFEGFSPSDENRYLSYIKNEIQNINGISKTSEFGKSEENIEVIIDKEKLHQFNLNDKIVLATILSQNLNQYTGPISSGDKNIRIKIDNIFSSVEDIGNMIILSRDETIRLKDIAKITRVKKNPSSSIFRKDGKSGVALGFSPEKGTNILETGKEIDKKIEELKKNLPIGVEINKIYYQPDLVKSAISNFVLNLVESIIVVVGVLLLVMGMRSGLIIGSGLVLSILTTLGVMVILKIDLHRVSLGSFIIAMGILVDNSIVVVDGILTSLEDGIERETSMCEPTRKVALPLLIATLVAIIAFLPTYLMETNAGEYTSSLFIIIGVSLLISWVLSMTQTPCYSYLYLKVNKKQKNNNNFSVKFYKGFNDLLKNVIHQKKMSIIVLTVALLFSIFLFLKVPQTFFPDSDKKGFIVKIWTEEGSKIEVTDDLVKKLEKKLLSDLRVESVTSAVGGSVPRFYIATIPESPHKSYAEIVVNTKTLKDVNLLARDIQIFSKKYIPDAEVNIRKYPNGVPTKYPVELRILGPDPKILRNISKEVETIFRSSKYTYSVTSDWRKKVLTWNSKFNQKNARATMTSPLDVSFGINRATQGTSLGSFKENNEIIPIILKEYTHHKNMKISMLGETPIWGMSPFSIPLKEFLTDEKLEWEDPIIIRYNGKRALKVEVDPFMGVQADTLRNDVLEKIEALEIPKGYSIQWGGEYHEQIKNVTNVSSFIPLQILLMFTLCVFLFKNLKEPLIIFLMLPLAIIGIAPGLLITGKSFGFMSIIGVVSLSGMMVKNGIVLIDQINYEINILKKDSYLAVINSATNRIRPVGLAAGTTILGMVPLIKDPLFGDLAATIIFGLTASTILTLLGIPLFYCIAYKIKEN